MIITVTLNAAVDKTYWVSPFSLGTTNRVTKLVTEAGGKGVNVAKVLATLGKIVTVTGFLGGTNGQELQQKLQEFNVVQDWIEVDGNTRNCLNIIDQSNKNETELLEKGPKVHRKDWQRFVMKINEIASRSNLILISGSLPAGLVDHAYEELISLLNELNVRVGIDTSGIPLQKSIQAKPTIIKLNIHELEAYCGKSLNTLDDVVVEAKLLYEKGIKYVFVSLGKDGAIAVSEYGIFKADIPSIEVVNTVGSGDATFAGIGAVLENGDDIQLALKSGMAAGIANSLQVGAGRVNKQDFLYYLEKISIRKIR
jgi:tagatose 6-phosphate kinase